MSHILRFPDLALGELEQEVLETLWHEGPLSPGGVHRRVGVARGISVNTVSSALKRLQDKGLLEREKVSHSYVYTAVVTRAELQRQLIGAIASRFAGEERSGLLAAFVDVAEAGGEETLRKLEAMIAARLTEGE
ncbi:penicillinase repressor [Lujinxingia litoralis]|uniref:Penicillinase repressor n=1 Tax=Lujinxingia litoralis TaxID=2211119 RepID=A0A328C2R6_9DELT|nr:BlaI/MecI/CopY family transcriptional regulator [Lujinxingia litoralis]RAL21007.1 penicillinase repressor [Lujinxingia litoralis]